MHKTIVYFLLLLLSPALSGSLKAQVGIGENALSSDTVHPCAMLDMNLAGMEGFLGALLPRIPLRSDTDRSAIASPDDYLMVFSPYTANTSHAGLNYWHGNRWFRIMNHTELYDSISAMHISQVILFAQLSAPEKAVHVTDQHNSTPYKIPIDKVTFDSQNAYSKSKYEYVIPEDGFYETVCNVELVDAEENQSMQTFIRINNKNTVNDLVNNTSKTPVGSVVHIAKLKKGDRVCGAVGLGSWNVQKYKVGSASLTIVKY
jgi:hypothetical protein